MKIKNSDINSFLNNIIPYKNPILLYGPDESLVFYRTKQIAKGFLNEKESKNSTRTIDNKQFKISDLNDELKTDNLFSKKEIIKIINPSEKLCDIVDTFEELGNQKNILVVIVAGELTPRSKLRKTFEENKNLAIIPCYKTDAILLKKTIVDFANKKAIKIEEGAIDYLLENLGENYQIIINELEKLLLLNEKSISYELVKGSISPNGSSSYEDIIFNCLNGKKDFFDHNIENSIVDISSANYLLFAMKNMLLTLAKTIKSYKNGNINDAIDTNMPKYLFKKKQIFTNIVKKNNYENIAESLKIISEIELKIRQNQGMFRVFLIRGMLNIAQNMK